MDKSRERKIGVILSYVVIFINLVISIFYTPILTRYLGQSEYGLYSMISSVISYLTILDFGFGSAIIVYASKYKNKLEKDKEFNLYGLFTIVYTIIGVLTAIIGIVLYLNVNNMFGKTMTVEELVIAKRLMAILAFNLVITFPLSVFSSIVNAYEEFIFIKIINIITIILKPIIMIPLLYVGYKSTTLVIVITLLNIFSLLMNMFYCLFKLKVKIKFNNLQYKLLIEIFAFSFWIFLNTIIDKVNWSLDNFLIGTISGTVAVSIYAIASQINQIFISFSTAISGVLLPKVTKMVDDGASDKEMTEIMVKTGRIQLIVIGLIITGFIVFGKDFFTLWVGEEYKGAYFIGIALMLPMVIALIQNSSASILQAKNMHKFMPKVLIVMSILNIIFSIPLIKLFDGLGAALGTAMSLIIGNVIIKNIYFYKVVKIDVVYFFKNIMKLLVAIFTYCILALILFNIWNIIFTRWLTLIGGIVIYSIVYFIIVIFFMNDYEKSFIKSLLKR